ncbi:TraR/DksA C4-type zinc finger protein [Bacillus songklensis]|uniref:TraR/DksA C4-type zinc finger protein n=1 Tax=Bacillus songklensis TaxID=1069116 RepID=A0ABV8B6B8_9BACI
MLSTNQMQSLRSQLQDRQKEIEQQFKINDHFGVRRSDFPYDSFGELSSYDNHPADIATEQYEREKDLALNEHAEQELHEVQHALQAIENGSYGKCKTCGKDIPFERLEAIPTTMFCKEHSPEQHISNDRPVEEATLDNPWGQHEYDEHSGTFYDAEDSWQEVARYGTSESPSDFLEKREIENYGETFIEAEDRVGYVEDYENFVAVDLYGNHISVYPTKGHDVYEQALDEEGVMTVFGDLHPFEQDPYVEEEEKE